MIWSVLVVLLEVVLATVAVLVGIVSAGTAHSIDQFLASGALWQGATVVILGSVSIYVLATAGTVVFDGR